MHNSLFVKHMLFALIVLRILYLFNELYMYSELFICMCYVGCFNWMQSVSMVGNCTGRIFRYYNVLRPMYDVMRTPSFLKVGVGIWVFVDSHPTPILDISAVFRRLESTMVYSSNKLNCKLQTHCSYRDQSWHNGTALDCRSTGQAIDFAPLAWFIPKSNSLASLIDLILA